MRILLALLLSVADQGLATALRSQVQSLVGQKLTGSSAIVTNINVVDEDGRNALHHAVILGNLPLVEFMIANRININGIDNDRRTSL